MRWPAPLPPAVSGDDVDLQVKSLTGKVILARLPLASTVEDLKQQIQQLEGGWRRPAFPATV